MRRLRLDLLGVVALLAVAACVLSLPAAVWGSSPIVVTTTLDGGRGSLRQAIPDADAGGSGSSIVFRPPGRPIPGSMPAAAGSRSCRSRRFRASYRERPDRDGSTQTAFTGDTNPRGLRSSSTAAWPSQTSARAPGPLDRLELDIVEGLTVSGFSGTRSQSARARTQAVGVRPTTEPWFAATPSGPTRPARLRSPAERPGVRERRSTGSSTRHQHPDGGTTRPTRNVISGSTLVGIELLLRPVTRRPDRRQLHRHQCARYCGAREREG